jgi:hypothetical protein
MARGAETVSMPAAVWPAHTLQTCQDAPRWRAADGLRADVDP